MTYPTKLSLCDNKYTVIFDFDKGTAKALRYDEDWRDLTGDKLILAMFDTIVDLKERLQREQRNQ